ncbi:MAG TPA: hypothetical protein VJZ26_17190 [Blastocatellia bacterium]|nr:hypothetical protein [Blastocatellia bacterium]
MLRHNSRAGLSRIFIAWLICSVILVAIRLVVSFADGNDPNRSEQAMAKPSSASAALADAQHRPTNSEAPALAAMHFEPLWLLALGATLLAIGSSIKHITKTAAKAPLTGGKTKRAL